MCYVTKNQITTPRIHKKVQIEMNTTALIGFTLNFFNSFVVVNSPEIPPAAPAAPAPPAIPPALLNKRYCYYGTDLSCPLSVHKLSKTD